MADNANVWSPDLDNLLASFGVVTELLTATTSGQTVFTVPEYVMGINAISVSIDGYGYGPLYGGKGFTETTTTSITLDTGVPTGTKLLVAVGASMLSSEGISAANVSFTAPVTGASASNVLTKLGAFAVCPKEDFEAAGDGLTDDTTKFQKCVDSGAESIYIGHDYVVSSVTIPATVKRIFGPGRILQSAVSNKTFVSTAANNIEIFGVTFVGAATSGSASLNNDSAIEFTGITGVNIHNCKFENYSYNTVYLINCTDSHVHDNKFKDVAHSIRYRGCSRCSMVANSQNGTILASTSFSIPFGIDSTNGHAYGICEDIIIANNRASNIPYGEGILVHAGTNVSIIGNVIAKMSLGIGLNPFNATDELTDVAIIGNTFEATTSVLWTTATGSDTDEAILIGGSAATTRPSGIAVIGNTIVGFNKVVDNSNQGGIVVGYSSNVALIGNTIRDCSANGIVASNAAISLLVANNMITDIVFNGAATHKNGLFVNHASAKVFTQGNFFRSISGTNSAAIRADAGTLKLGQNHFDTVDTDIANFGATVTDKDIKSYTSGTTVDLSQSDIIEFDASGGAITIGSGSSVWSNVIKGRRYIFRNVGGSNSVTLTRDATFCKTIGGANVVLAPGETVEFIGGSAVNRVEQLLPKTAAIS